MAKNGIKKEDTVEVTKDLSVLLDSTYPLIKKLRELCPGTNKHSQALAAMVEGVSIALGLDVTFMKVAAQYHDIGKLNNPKYFSENQLEGEDSHADLDPWMSAQIISRHVSDGVCILLNDNNFSREIIEIISQHHGTEVIKYFFDKSGSELDDLFRYKSFVPKCVESAVLMICDKIEATSKSKFQSGTFDPLEVIESVINGLINDNQLDDVVIRLGDIKLLKDALAKELEGIYQKRVDYDKAKAESKSKSWQYQKLWYTIK